MKNLTAFVILPLIASSSALHGADLSRRTSEVHRLSGIHCVEDSGRVQEIATLDTTWENAARNRNDDFF